MREPEDVRLYLKTIKERLKIPLDDKNYQIYDFYPSDYHLAISMDKKYWTPISYFCDSGAFNVKTNAYVREINSELVEAVVYFLKATGNNELISEVITKL